MGVSCGIKGCQYLALEEGQGMVVDKRGSLALPLVRQEWKLAIPGERTERLPRIL